MKNQMLKMGVVAALVLGSSTMAYAATPTQSAKLTVHGEITPTTCDVSLLESGDVNLGTWLATDFASINTQLGSQTRTLNLGNCQGDAVQNTHSIALQLEGYDQDPVASQNGLFADSASGVTKVGIAITGAVGTASAKDITPVNNTIPVFTSNDASGTEASSITVEPVTLTMALQNYDVTVAAGKVNSVITASAVYQ